MPKRYVPMYRRRREGVTDYRARYAMLKSGKIRLVVRRSNKYITVQFVEAKPEGDRTIVGVNSIVLKKYDWKLSCKNSMAAYLIGYLAGLKALKKGVKEAILDIGLRTSVKGCRIYCCLKGVLDAGIHVPHSPEILPDEDRIKGRILSEYYAKVMEENPEMLKKIFSQYNRLGVKPEDIPSMVDQVLENIRKEVGSS